MKKLFGINPEKKQVQREIGRKGVERNFVNSVTKRGFKCYKFTSEMNRGVSDRIVLLPGQVWFVEIKRENTDLSPLQIEFQKLCKTLGLNHFVVYGKPGIKKFWEKVCQKKS